jgi:hypothetical protein
MTGQPPAPGHDEIIVTVPAAGELCHSLEHRRAGCPAQVVVTLGQMGTAGQHREALWMQAWGRSYPMCGPCWQTTRHAAQTGRPGLVIIHAARPPGTASCPAP